jgi:NTE family protein
VAEELAAGVTAPSGAEVALVLGGGGARGAYQAGVVYGLAKKCPWLRFPILTGISAGAVNTLHLASDTSPLAGAAANVVALWRSLTPEQVYDVRATQLLRTMFRWGARLASGGIGSGSEPMKGMVITQPLRDFLTRSLRPLADGSIEGVTTNLAAGTLRAVALSATSYTTGQSVTWVQGRDVQLWQRPARRSEMSPLGVEHVMASSALPMLFPAVQVGSEWYGDGGIRLTSPLSPALHLGATHILTISTRYRRSEREAKAPQTVGYPPPAAVLGALYNAIFLDQVDEDIARAQRVNGLLEGLPSERRDGMRKVEILVIRPSRDLGRLAGEYEAKMPMFLKYVTRGLGTQDTSSPDVLSYILFQPDYIRLLLELGERDGEEAADRVAAFAQAGG